jgi:hypothetical protein
MASRFWVGGTGTWDGTDTSHWAATTGGASGASAPVGGDVVTFDANSGAAATVTVAATAAAATVTLNKSDLTLLHGAANTTWCTGTFTLTSGIWNTGGFNLTLGLFSSNTPAQTITMGASTITVTGTTTSWNCVVPGNRIVTANTATIVMANATSANFAGGATTNWNGASVVFSGFTGTPQMNPTTGLKNLTFAGGAVKGAIAQLNGSLTISGTLTLGGNSTQGVNRLLVQSDVNGTQRTITCAAVVIAGDVDFMDTAISFSGAVSWTNTGNAFIGDCGGNGPNIGANITPSAVQSQSISASFSWSTAAWSGRVPLPQDDVTITGNGTGKVITCDMPRLGRSIDATVVTGGGQWSFVTATSIYGSIGMASVMTAINTQTVTLAGRGNYTINTNNVSLSSSWIINAPGGTYTMMSAFTLSVPGNTFGLSLTSGTLDLNSQTMLLASFTVNAQVGAITRSLLMRNSIVQLAGTGGQTVWNMRGPATGMTLDTGTSAIQIVATDGSTKTFAGAGLTYYNLQAVGTASGLTITGNNTFRSLDLEYTTARTITLPAGSTQTVTGSLTLQGASGQILSLVSSTPGTSTTIIAAPGASITQSNYSLSSDVIIDAQFTSAISAPSTVSGTVTDIRHVSGSISATSTLTGRLGAVRHISGGIAAIAASVSLVGVLRRLPAGGIFATSSLTGGPRITPIDKLIPQTAIFATSTMTAGTIRFISNQTARSGKIWIQ